MSTGAPSAPVAPVDVAVIGLGAISQSVHLPLIRRHPERFRLTAVVDLSAERAASIARAHGVEVRAYDGVEALLAAVAAGEVHVAGAVLATSGSHAGDVSRLLEAGIRVLAEKPLAFSAEEIAELRATAERLGIDLEAHVRVGYMKELDPAVAEAARRLEGVRPRAVHVEVLHPADGAQLAFANLLPPPGDVPAETVAALQEATAGIVRGAIGETEAPLPLLYTNVVLGSVIHDIGVLRRLLGGIGAVEHARHWGGFPGSLHLAGSLERHPETPWSLDWHFIPDYPAYRETVTVHHEQGSIRLVFAVPYVLNAPTVLELVERAEPLGERRSETRWMQEEAFERELLAFADLVDGRPQPGPSVDAAAADLAVGTRMIGAIAESLGRPLHASAGAAEAAPTPPGRAGHPEE